MTALQTYLAALAPGIDIVAGCAGMSEDQLRAAGAPNKTARTLLTLADATNTVLVYPDGVDRHFNDCRSILPVTARAENVDDVAFAAFLVEEMRREFGTARTFACGYRSKSGRSKGDG